MEYTIYDGLAAGLAVMLLCCSFTVPALALTCELAGMMRKKVLIDKYALQTSRLGLLFIFAIFLATAGAWTASTYVMDFYLPEISGFWIEYDLFWDFSLYISLVSLLVYSLYYFLWNRLRNLKSLHVFLGSLGVLSAGCLVTLILWAMFRELMIIPDLFPDPDSIFLPLVVQVYIIALGAGAVFSLNYLLVRRTRDDFGRDYYRFALNFGAKWGIFFVVFSPVTCVWLFLLMGDSLDFTYTVLPGAGYALGVVALALILWRIASSDQPLRNKAAIIICPLIVWSVFVFRLVSYLEFANLDQEKTVIHTFVRDWPILF